MTQRLDDFDLYRREQSLLQDQCRGIDLPASGFFGQVLHRRRRQQSLLAGDLQKVACDIGVHGEKVRNLETGARGQKQTLTSESFAFRLPSSTCFTSC